MTPKIEVVRAIGFDFDGVFTDDRVITSQSGEESVICSRSDGLGIGMLQAAGIRMIIISKEPNPVVAMRAKKLKLEVIQGCNDKLPELLSWLHRIDCPPDEAAYMGNDINDLECLRAVGLAIVPCDAHPSAVAVADVVTRRPGGNGAIREIADLLISNLKEP